MNHHEAFSHDKCDHCSCCITCHSCECSPFRAFIEAAEDARNALEGIDGAHELPDELKGALDLAFLACVNLQERLRDASKPKTAQS